MGNEVESVGTSDFAEVQQRTLELNSLSEQTAVSELQASNLSQMVEQGLGAALSSPDKQAAGKEIRDSIVSSATGLVGEHKATLISEIERPGIGSPSEETTDRTHDQLIDRSRELYTDLTVYNVAWSVAIRVQKDISQLLRGN